MTEPDMLWQPPPLGPVVLDGTQQRLFVGRGLDLQSTADQVLTKMFHGTRYIVQAVLACGRSGGATVTCLGGIYTGPGKSGSVLVAAAQSWVGVSAAGKIVQASLAAILGTDEQTAAPLYFSLTTGSITAATADVFVIGIPTD